MAMKNVKAVGDLWGQERLVADAYLGEPQLLSFLVLSKDASKLCSLDGGHLSLGPETCCLLGLPGLCQIPVGLCSSEAVRKLLGSDPSIMCLLIPARHVSIEMLSCVCAEWLEAEVALILQDLGCSLPL